MKQAAFVGHTVLQDHHPTELLHGVISHILSLDAICSAEHLTTSMLFPALSSHLKLLVVSDVDIQSAVRLTEKFVCNDAKAEFDACIVCGPFIHRAITTPEEEASCEGDMSSIIAQFENIVCRVIYVPGDRDPTKTLSEQLHLTPNSVNLHARCLPLMDGVYISGVAEKECNLSESQTSADSDDEDIADVHIQTSSSAKIIEEVLTNGPSYAFPSSATPPTGIFVLNYKYSHTLNNFLFFQTELLNRALVQLSIIPALEDENFELPKQHNGMAIASPKSLRRGGCYTVVDLELNNGSWKVSNITDTKIE